MAELSVFVDMLGLPLEGVGFEHLIPYLWPMALIAAFTLSLATWMFRNKVQ